LRFDCYWQSITVCRWQLKRIGVFVLVHRLQGTENKVDKLANLLKDLEALDAQIDAILANDDLTAEQLTQHDDLVASRARVSASVKAEKDRLARKQELDNLALEMEESQAKEAEQEAKRKAIEDRKARIVAPPAGTNRITQPNVPAVQVSEGRRMTIPATVHRSKVRYFQGTRNGYEAEERAYRFGMWALAQVSLQMPNRFNFQAAVDFFNSTYKYATAHLSNNSTGAGNLVPEEFSSDLIDLREQYGVARRLFRHVPMASDTIVIPRRSGGLTTYFVGEGSAVTESNKTWDNVRLTARKLGAITRWSSELSMDSVIGLGDDLAREIAYAFTKTEDDCAFNGDGTSTYGGITGVCTKLQDVDGAGTDSSGLVTGAGNEYSELTLNNFHSVLGKLPMFARTPNVTWVASNTFYHTVMERLAAASGGVTWGEIKAGSGPQPMFLGLPVTISMQMPVTQANTQVCALLGDFSLGAAFGDRQQDSIAFSEHAYVNSESVFERDQIAIRGIERFDINVHDVGSSSSPGPIVGLQTLGS
jgi:HK97 family phage major capsid protein